MIIHDLDLMGISVYPLEAEPPLVVNTNAVLSCSVTFWLLQSVTRGLHQIL
jgi:hypothetical protein